METKRHKKSGQRGRKIRGMASTAKSLGVGRVTLWRAINGKTNNPELVSRYRAIVSMQASTPKPV